MSDAKALPPVAMTVCAAMLALLAAQAGAEDDRASGNLAGVSIQIDNDLLAGREMDRDYTGGMSVTISGARARDGVLSLDPMLAAFDRSSGNQAADRQDGISLAPRVHHARQFGLMAFTPADTLTRAVQPNDRPYASLLWVSNGRMQVQSDDSAHFSSLTIGVLGLSLSEHLHGAVHELVGSARPRGYEHQISAGGEPTARYSVARHRLWVAHPSGKLDVKTTLQGSIGYLTEASIAMSARFGRIDTPWWGFAPELADYMAAPVPVTSGSGPRELYFFLGGRVKARAYNAFLQGQFRDSAVRYSAHEVQHLLLDLWIGMTMQLFEQTQLSYTLNYQTAELRTGQAKRDALWGSVQVAHTF